ncbi:hypothetical protein GCM10010275_00800 [Streptomyces litmocidini]|uniref:hypothetical protein n=1 Tax=Streptomyces litmocidini TaxID=67318 RepID=UPI00167C6247|nr:hypothetical protein [Streptomyces litmocidini]GGU70713.1 hypothetical protein GCM10010275_00800 [Streptomyces litmocidini]
MTTLEGRDAAAGKAFRAGPDLDADRPGFPAGHAEPCLRADGSERPGRAARAAALSRRVGELGPGSAGADRDRTAPSRPDP